MRAPDDDPALGEGDFLAKLGQLVPAGAAEGRGNELGADVALAELLLVHAAEAIVYRALSSFPALPTAPRWRSWSFNVNLFPHPPVFLQCRKTSHARLPPAASAA